MIFYKYKRRKDDKTKKLLFILIQNKITLRCYIYHTMRIHDDYKRVLLKITKHDHTFQNIA